MSSKYLIATSGPDARAREFSETETRYETWDEAHGALLGIIQRELNDSMRIGVRPTRAERERSAMASYARNVAAEMMQGAAETVSLSRRLSLRIETAND